MDFVNTHCSHSLISVRAAIVFLIVNFFSLVVRCKLRMGDAAAATATTALTRNKANERAKNKSLCVDYNCFFVVVVVVVNFFLFIF